jgi:hypothetical protein
MIPKLTWLERKILLIEGKVTVQKPFHVLPNGEIPFDMGTITGALFRRQLVEIST